VQETHLRAIQDYSQHDGKKNNSLFKKAKKNNSYILNYNILYSSGKITSLSKHDVALHPS
jgi:hypothetical protein